MCGFFIHCHAAIFLHYGFNCCNALWCHHSVAWPGRSQSITELMPFMNFSVHSYTCCSDRHASPYWTFIRRWISMGFHPSLRCSSSMHVASGAAVFTLLLRCRTPASCCHLSATLQTMSNTVANLQENRAVFRIFIAFLSFSFLSPSPFFLFKMPFIS
jgi:hypothetical protein